MATVRSYAESNDVEREYSRYTSLEHRRKFAQFFTPFPIAELMVKWLLGTKKLNDVLDPAFGLGIFSRVLLNQREELNIKGFEIDTKIFEKSKCLFEDRENVNLVLGDYMYNDWENKYDGIICNPPYFKFHDYDNKNVLREVEEKTSFKLNGFTNLYSLFLLKSIYQLNHGGRAAYIIPSEFLNSDYGALVKSYLVKSKTLRHIIVVDFAENVFDDALTTASILLSANDNGAEEVQFSNVNTLDDLQKINELIEGYPNRFSSTRFVSFENLNPEIKWRTYYQTQNSTKFKNLVSFANYGKVVRGIATGSNDYFTFNTSKANKYKIGTNSLLPCICKAVDARSPFFTNDDFEDLKANNKAVFLLNAKNSPDEHVKRYIEIGVELEVNKKFLTASRNPWYSLENRPPSPIWVSVFNRNGLRFIRNEAGISNLTTFHCIYLNMFSLPKADLLFAYLLTDVSRKIFEDNRREYGNGLQKFEPNDINKAKMLDLEKLDSEAESRILEYYQLYRQSVLDKTPKDCLIDLIGEIFKERYTL